jgi:hypothetical protein
VERPPSKFRAGDAVEVIASDKNRTYHKGRVRQVTWHFKDREWNFFIEENGKKNQQKISSNRSPSSG